MNVPEANSLRERGDPWLYDRHRPSPPRAFVDAILRRVPRQHPAVLDLACGTGKSTRPWIGGASRLVGVDADDSKLAVAKARSPEIEFRCVFAHETGLATGSFDIVTCVQALHWLEPEPTFREIRRLLRPAGVFAALDTNLFPAPTDALERCMSLAKAIVSSRGRAHDQRLWEKEHFTEHFESLGRVEELNLEGLDSFDLAARLRTTGDVAMALAAGVTEQELRLDEVVGSYEGPVVFYARLAIQV